MKKGQTAALPTVDSVLQDSRSAAFVILDGNGGITRWNAGAQQLLGYPAAEVVRVRSFDDLLDRTVHVESVISFVQGYMRKAGRGVNLETVCRDSHGREVHVNWHFEPLGGPGEGVMAIGENITARKIVERHLVESREGYATLVRLLPDVVFIIDHEGVFTFVNESVAQLGYAPQDLLGRHFRELVHPADLPAVDRATVLPLFRGKVTGPLHSPKLFDERRTGSRKTVNLEVRLVSKRQQQAGSDGGTGIVCTINTSGIYLQQGRQRQYTGTIGVIRDMTEQHRIYEKHAHMENQLTHARKLEAIGQLAGGVAHDFNNMLSGIMGFAEVIRQRNTGDGGAPVDAALGSDIEVIIKAAQRAADLTNNLLAFSRQGKYRQVEIDIHESIRSVIALLTPTTDRRVRFKTRFHKEPARIQGDPTLIENVFLNLALNAIDAMPTGGTLTFETLHMVLDEEYVKGMSYHMDPGPYVLIAVRDNGMGMSESLVQRIFEPFFTTKEPGKGTGLGLASVYGTVKGHQGSIEVESAVGKGTTFRILLPLRQQEAAAEQHPGAIAPHKGHGLVLVVDDEEIVRSILTRMLEDLGYQVHACANGAQAVAYYKEQGSGVAAVVLDINMPVMSGNDCFRLLHEINPGVKVLISTGYTVQDEARQLLSQGVAGIVQKPFSIETLAEQLHVMLTEEEGRSKKPSAAAVSRL